MTKFVCAFRGRRDSYQVPVALAEIERLECFVTDHYYGVVEKTLSRILPRRIAEKASARFDECLPVERIRRLHSTALAEFLHRAIVGADHGLYARFDPNYGLAAALEAQRTKSDLFMYSPYAFPAFSAKYKHDPHKILFQYHPHWHTEATIISSDVNSNRRAGLRFDKESLYSDPTTSEHRRRSDDAWQSADHVVCASSFTRKSLLSAGADPTRISVVPYGVSIGKEQEWDPNGTAQRAFRVLFVGNAVQRKGLHHLLLAWKSARLPKGARLTIVARVLDLELVPLLHTTPGVELCRGVSARRLTELYATSTLFVMPSLVEGFGQVYLEALSHGLPVLGTENTCCPDLGSEADGIYTTSPGQVDELVFKLEWLSSTLPGSPDVRGRARQCAARFTWASFRRRIQEIAMPATAIA